MTTALRTPLHDCHVESGGRIVEFAGYDLPVQYKSVIAESQAVRSGVGMFDVSHMARLRFTGPSSLAFLEWATTNDVAKLEPGQGHYSLLPNAEGGVVDDIILYCIGESDYKMVVNAANHQKDVAHFRGLNLDGVELEDYTAQTAMIAVQGPEAVQLVASLCDQPGLVHDSPLFASFEANLGGVPCYLARSGYTGEDGYEIQCPAGQSADLWRRLASTGAVPCGLGSRDTLRVEAGLPLYGHELADDLSPLAAGLGWVISKTKEFLGSGPMGEARANGTPVKLQGIRLESKRVPQPGSAVTVDGHRFGEMSSGVYSPLLERGIGFAFIDPTIKLETPCEVDFRGKPESGTVVGKRFFRRS